MTNLLGLFFRDGQPLLGIFSDLAILELKNVSSPGFWGSKYQYGIKICSPPPTPQVFGIFQFYYRKSFQGLGGVFKGTGIKTAGMLLEPVF